MTTKRRFLDGNLQQKMHFRRTLRNSDPSRDVTIIKLITRDQFGFIVFNKCTALLLDVNNQGSWVLDI